MTEQNFNDTIADTTPDTIGSAAEQAVLDATKVEALAAKHRRPNKVAALLTGTLLESARSIADTTVLQLTASMTDGQDVISVGAKAETEIGKLLYINARSHLDLSAIGLGSFESVGGLYNWLRSGVYDEVSKKVVSRNESFRQLHGRDCQIQGKKIQQTRAPDPSWRKLVAIATWIKVNASRENMMLMAESTLPFADYYFADGSTVPTTSPMNFWYAPMLEAIRDAVKANLSGQADAVTPDFDFLVALRANPAPRRYDGWRSGDNDRRYKDNDRRYNDRAPRARTNRSDSY